MHDPLGHYTQNTASRILEKGLARSLRSRYPRCWIKSVSRKARWNMTLGIRKLIVLVLVAALFLMANLIFLTNWLAEKGVIDWAKYFHKEYLTGTAITIIVVLLILLVAPRSEARRLFRQCPVCDHTLLGSGRYCSDCGSHV
jgi:hypothetical protein